MKTLQLILFTLLAHTICAQDWPYSLDLVPDSLKKNAHVVVHVDDGFLEVESPEKATMHTHRVYTVLNEEGKHALFFNEYSSKYVTLEDVEIKVYDAKGKLLNKYKKKELMTVSVGEGLIEDGYVTYHHFGATHFPVTVEVRMEQKFKSSFYPGFYFIGAHEGVVSSNYTVKIPQSMNLRFKAKNTDIRPLISDDAKYRTYKWSVARLKPLEHEEGTVSARSRYPHVNIVTDQFSFYGSQGSMASWKNFGEWLNQLYTGMDELPEDRKKFFNDLVKDIPDEAGRIKRIYQYMQDNFRYVSIQLGIGGMKPFSASFTDQKKYGDCKALSNYMKAALKAVGIQSHIAIINAQYNEEPVDPDFPANNFNHAILCVPAKDSIWLECTSSTAEFGKLGTFTENRNALLITDQGGVLVSTPKSDPSTNRLVSHTRVKVESDLSAISETNLQSRGEFKEVLSAILRESRDDQKKAVVYYLGFKQPDDFVLLADSIRGGTLLKMALRKVQEFNSGDKYFISPRIHKTWSSKLPMAQNRKMDFYFRFPFEKMDTTVFVLQPSMKPDAMPQVKEINSTHAYYQSKSWYEAKEHAIYTTSVLVLKRHKIPAKDYAAVRSFFEEVMQDDSQRIVIKRTEAPPVEKKTF